MNFCKDTRPTKINTVHILASPPFRHLDVFGTQSDSAEFGPMTIHITWRHHDLVGGQTFANSGRNLTAESCGKILHHRFDCSGGMKLFDSILIF